MVEIKGIMPLLIRTGDLRVGTRFGSVENPTVDEFLGTSFIANGYTKFSKK